MNPQLAIGLPPGPAVLRDVPTAVARWERAGYRSVWASEVAGPDFATILGAVGAVARRYGGFELGVGVAPVQTRAPWLLAATGASLATISGKPFSLGIGASSELIVADWSGRDASRPLTQVRETLTVLRQALAGERTGFVGRSVRSKRYRLPWIPDAEVRVLVGATGSKALRQAGAIADGIVLTMVAPEHVPVLLADVQAGRRDSTAPVSRCQHTVVLASCGVTRNETDRRAALRESLLSYVATKAYGDMLIRLGFATDVRRLRELFAARERERAVASFPDELLDALVAVGPPGKISGRIRGYFEAGADTVVVDPLGNCEDDWFRTWKAAQEALA